MWPDDESARLAELHRKQRLYRAALRIDSRYRPIRACAPGTAHFRDGQVELAGARVPHRLFRAIGRIDAVRHVKYCFCAKRQFSGVLIDREHGEKRRAVVAIRDEEDPALRVVGYFIGTVRADSS